MVRLTWQHFQPPDTLGQKYPAIVRSPHYVFIATLSFSFTVYQQKVIVCAIVCLMPISLEIVSSHLSYSGPDLSIPHIPHIQYP